jgi:hypothetical protein
VHNLSIGEEIRVTREDIHAVQPIPSDMFEFQDRFPVLPGAQPHFGQVYNSSQGGGAPRRNTTASNTMKLWLKGPRHENPKWVYLKYDSKFSHNKVFHVEFYWIGKQRMNDFE